VAWRVISKQDFQQTTQLTLFFLGIIFALLTGQKDIFEFNDEEFFFAVINAAFGIGGNFCYTVAVRYVIINIIFYIYH
jgi:hypothetical protein